MSIPVWILTFNRPLALNRLITTLGRQGLRVNVFSNHPDVMYSEESNSYVDQTIINTLNSAESNSWCARSWNTMMMKGFANSDELIMIHDDTMVAPGFHDWIKQAKQQYDFIWGTAGDQFYYLKFDVLKTVGWWDERYIGCYCGDADWLKRIFMTYDNNKLSAQDTHNWGFHHNPCGVMNYINVHVKNVDPNYENQHEELERKAKGTVICSQTHFRNKWGKDLDNGRPVIEPSERLMTEIDWYPWFSNRYFV